MITLKEFKNKEIEIFIKEYDKFSLMMEGTRGYEWFEEDLIPVIKEIENGDFYKKSKDEIENILNLYKRNNDFRTAIYLFDFPADKSYVIDEMLKFDEKETGRKEVPSFLLKNKSASVNQINKVLNLLDIDFINNMLSECGFEISLRRQKSDLPDKELYFSFIDSPDFLFSQKALKEIFKMYPKLTEYRSLRYIINEEDVLKLYNDTISKIQEENFFPYDKDLCNSVLANPFVSDEKRNEIFNNIAEYDIGQIILASTKEIAEQIYRSVVGTYMGDFRDENMERDILEFAGSSLTKLVNFNKLSASCQIDFLNRLLSADNPYVDYYGVADGIAKHTTYDDVIEKIFNMKDYKHLHAFLLENKSLKDEVLINKAKSIIKSYPQGFIKSDVDSSIVSAAIRRCRCDGVPDLEKSFQYFVLKNSKNMFAKLEISLSSSTPDNVLKYIVDNDKDIAQFADLNLKLKTTVPEYTEQILKDVRTYISSTSTLKFNVYSKKEYEHLDLIRNSSVANKFIDKKSLSDIIDIFEKIKDIYKDNDVANLCKNLTENIIKENGFLECIDMANKAFLFPENKKMDVFVIKPCSHFKVEMNIDSLLHCSGFDKNVFNSAICKMEQNDFILLKNILLYSSFTGETTPKKWKSCYNLVEYKIINTLSEMYNIIHNRDEEIMKKSSNHHITSETNETHEMPEH